MCRAKVNARTCHMYNRLEGMFNIISILFFMEKEIKWTYLQGIHNLHLFYAFFL